MKTFFTLLILFLSSSLAAQTVIMQSGPSHNRVDMVILGDGFTADEMGTYAAKVDKLVQGFFDQQPFSEYKNFFNVRRVDVISNESGADKDTALDARYDGRMIVVNTSKVYEIINNMPPDQIDTVLIVVNDTRYGGANSGGFAVFSGGTDMVELALHEFGHTFARLGDEYDTTCKYVEPHYPNLTINSYRDHIKWNHWFDINTPIPTPWTWGAPGLYGTPCKYRPMPDTKMRSLYRPFGPINEEQFVLKVYNWVSPIDSSSPRGFTEMYVGDSQEFKINPLEPMTHSLDVSWYVDGELKSEDFEFEFTPENVGVYQIRGEVTDPTQRVRKDVYGLLYDERIWQITVLCEDNDGDGVCNTDDMCADDPEKVFPGLCGCGEVDVEGCGVVEPEPEPEPIDPEPVEPQPEPEPIEPEPIEPEPIEPDPVEPEPVKPDPVEPEPEPEPIEPDPIDPQPEPEPEPIKPNPVEPEPIEPDPVETIDEPIDPAEPEPIEPEPVEPDPIEPEEPIKPEPIEPEPEQPVEPVKQVDQPDGSGGGGGGGCFINSL